MNKILTNMRKSDGYISVETIIIAGFLIIVGTVLITCFAVEGQELTMKGNETIESIDFEKMSDFENRETTYNNTNNDMLNQEEEIINKGNSKINKENDLNLSDFKSA